MDEEWFKEQLQKVQEATSTPVQLDFPELKSPPLKINTAVFARVNQQMDAIQEYHQAKDKAVFDTAKHLKSINGKVQSIDDGLSKERAEREKADEANKRYTQMWNKINLAIGIIGVILAAFALFKP